MNYDKIQNTRKPAGVMRRGWRMLLVPTLFALLPMDTSAQNSADFDDEDNETQTAAGANELVITDADGGRELIEMPEGIVTEMDSLLKLYNSQMYLSIDGDCNYKEQNPDYTDEEYIERLSRLPDIIEMPYNRVVRRFIDAYATRLRRGVCYWLGASNFYMPIFEQALETYNLPLELRYLPVIESGLNPNAVSRVGATGLWQFMLATARKYGLKVNSLVDERRDPIKASNAAARYLSDLYKIFGDWNLVIAAYNCGPDKINQAIHRAGGARDYWKIYPYLPRETRGYVPAFIAANYIMNYYCEHNICPMRTTLPAKSDTVMVARDVHLRQIAAVCDLDMEALRTLNPQYRRDIVNGSSELSAIRLPDDAVARFIDNEEAVYAYRANELLTRRAVVDVDESQLEGEEASTAYEGRRNYGRSYSRGHRSAAAKRAYKAGKTSKSKKRSRAAQSKSVTIKSGETLSSIAKKNHTTVAKLKKLNKISGSNIRAGKKLKVK